MSKLNQAVSFDLFVQDADYIDLPPRRVSIEESVIYLTIEPPPPPPPRRVEGGPLAIELPASLGFETRDGGTELFKTVADGDLAGYELVLKGSGFTVDGDGDPTAGTVSEIEILKNGDKVAGMELILSFAVTDFIAAIEAGDGSTYSPSGYADLSELLVPSGAFLIGQGSNGADTFFGSSGNDRINVRKGNDIVFMFEGNDKLDGDAGADLVDARHVETAVSIDLVKEKARNGDFASKLIDFEHVVGSAFGDKIKGNGEANRLFGAEGDDALAGRGGKDVFIFSFDGSTDRVTDFDDGKDKLDLQAFQLETKAQALLAFTELGTKNDSKVQLSFEGTTVLITGADLKDISGADIII